MTGLGKSQAVANEEVQEAARETPVIAEETPEKKGLRPYYPYMIGGTAAILVVACIVVAAKK